MIEDLVTHLRERYPGVFLAVKQDCRAYADRVVTDWTFWHGGANQLIGPYPTAKGLLAGIDAWEASGERTAAEQVHRQQEEAAERLATLTAERDRLLEETLHRAMPLDEALNNPDAFVEGMEETSEIHDRLPPHLDPNRDLGDPVG